LKLSAFAKYGDLAASTRQRLLQYIPHLEAAGIEVDCHYLAGNDYVRSLASGAGYSRLGIARAYAERLAKVLRGPDGDVIWVYAEMFPYLPAGFEKLVFRSGKPVVYDFDDAFFHQYDESESALQRRLLGGKLEPLLERAAACCCGNAYLRDFANRFRGDSMILPTVVDTDIYEPGDRANDGPPVIGWIGSPSTWRFVQPYLPLLAELAREQGVKVRVVGAGAAARDDLFPGLELVEWSKDSEVSDVQAMDIGIMPLPDEPWAWGKSGYKLIQYMACGLPVVASPVGVNREIVQDETGYLASGADQWKSALSRLIDSPDLRRRMGDAGRRRAEAEYSLATHAPRLTELLLRLGQTGRRP
jgi:glycosyltransferase involved in cell wall biosynthesis